MFYFPCNLVGLRKSKISIFLGSDQRELQFYNLFYVRGHALGGAYASRIYLCKTYFEDTEIESQDKWLTCNELEDRATHHMCDYNKR